MTYLRRNRVQSVRWPVPADVLMDIVDTWIAQQPEGQALTTLGARTGLKDVQTTLRRLRNGQSWVSFETADRLVTATAGPNEWHTNPKLTQVTDWLDSVLGPYCDECWARTVECECQEAQAA